MSDKFQEPIHYGHLAHSGLVTLLCTNSVADRSWVRASRKTPVEVFLRDDGMLYALKVSLVTCGQCLRACPKTPRVGAKYKHFKGHVYTVTGLVKCSETLKDLVIYADEKSAWARPAEIFSEFTVKDGMPVLRFQVTDEEKDVEV